MTESRGSRPDTEVTMAGFNIVSLLFGARAGSAT